MNPLTMLEYVLESNDLESIKNYAQFLSQKPEKWMFVPCDEEGNVLEEPENVYPFATNEESIEYDELFDEYKQALDRVIFEGFEVFEVFDLFVNNGEVSFSMDMCNSLYDLINEHGDFLTLKKPIQ